MKLRPKQIADGDHHEQRDRDRDDQLALQRGGVGVGLARRLLDDDRPAELRDARGDAELAAAVLVGVFLRDRRRVGARSRGGEQLVAAHVARLRDQRLLVGVAVRDQLAARGDDQREAVIADADLIDHPPHFFEAELADEPAGRLVQVRQADGEHRRRQQILVDADRRHRDAVDRQLRVLRDRDARLADAARGDHRALLVEQRDLAELAELQDVVLEDLILLALVEAGVLQVGGERLQQLGVGDDVAADFLGGADGDVLVAVDDRFAGAALQREDRDDAVGEQRHHGGDAEQQREARGDVPDLHRQFRLACCRRRRPASRGAACCRMSRPGFGVGTTNRLLTARARSVHARKIAGGSSIDRLLERRDTARRYSSSDAAWRTRSSAASTDALANAGVGAAPNATAGTAGTGSAR